MAVLLETSKGDIVIDLLVQECPLACKNFLKLCKVKYYNNCIFHNVQRNFIVQTGDPTASGTGGSSIYGLLYGEQARFFEDELRPHLKHKRKGTVGMASAGENLNASQFYMTATDNIDSLDGKHTVFGQIAEGFDVLDKISEAFVDDAGRPLQNIRIRHTIVLDDPFDDPDELVQHIPDQSPEPQFEQGGRLEDDWVLDQDTRPAEVVEQETRRADAHNRAVVLEMIGDLPEADAAPPSNMLFICKLNQVTTEEDLEIIFSRFGTITSCDIIRDWKTGDSLCYAFIGFDNDVSCEEAYFKMNNVLIDDRRIKVDFSQSVHHLWKQFKKGGRKGGNAAMAAEAAGHERDGNVASQRLGGSSGRLELKGQPRRGPAMLMGDDDLDDARGQPQQQQHLEPVRMAREGMQQRGSRDDPERRAATDHKRSRENEEGLLPKSGRSEGLRGQAGGSRQEERGRDRDTSKYDSLGGDRHRERDRDRDEGQRKDRDSGRSADKERDRERDKSMEDRDRDRGKYDDRDGDGHRSRVRHGERQSERDRQTDDRGRRDHDRARSRSRDRGRDSRDRDRERDRDRHTDERDRRRDRDRR